MMHTSNRIAALAALSCLGLLVMGSLPSCRPGAGALKPGPADRRAGRELRVYKEVMSHLTTDDLLTHGLKPEALLRRARTVLVKAVPGLAFKERGMKTEVWLAGRRLSTAPWQERKMERTDRHMTRLAARLEKLRRRLGRLFGQLEREPGPKRDWSALEHDIVRAMLKAADRYSNLWSKGAYRDLRFRLRRAFGGLGIMVVQDRGRLVVREVFTGTPALRAGLQPGDHITAIDGKPAGRMGLTRAIRALRGAIGSTAVLLVARPGWPRPRRLEVKRAAVVIRNVLSRRLGDGLGYLRIRTFRRNTGEAVKHGLARLGGAGKRAPRGLILDLRGNPGGGFAAAVNTAGLFLEEGVPVVLLKTAPDNTVKERAFAYGLYRKAPLVVLVDGASRSAAELVAGALKAHGRALLLGFKTHGKGSVQALHHLESGSVLQLTVAEYLTHRGGRIESRGVAPHLALGPARPGLQPPRSLAQPTGGKRDPLLKLARAILSAALKAGARTVDGMKRLALPLLKAARSRLGRPPFLKRGP